MTNRWVSIHLPPPSSKGGMSLAEAIARRKSIRRYTRETITQSQLSQLLWSAQGITDVSSERRSVPSAGATYPLEIFVVCGDNCIENIEAGIYWYSPEEHSLHLHYKGDARLDLSEAALAQEYIVEAPLNIVICAVYERTALFYGPRAERYINMEAGHAGQNIYLQATALGLGTVAIGAFDDEPVREVLRLDKQYEPLYIFPIGKPR